MAQSLEGTASGLELEKEGQDPGGVSGTPGVDKGDQPIEEAIKSLQLAGFSLHLGSNSYQDMDEQQ